MKKIVLLAAIAAMVASVGITPALAQSFDQDIDESGDVNQSSEIVNTGDNSNQCAAPMQVGNTGSLQNAQGFQTGSQGSQDDASKADLLNALENGDFGENVDLGDFANLVDSLDSDNANGGNTGFGEASFEGPSFEISPEQSVECNQVVDQDATAVSTY